MKKFFFLIAAFLAFFLLSTEKTSAEEYKIKDYVITNIEKVRAINHLNLPADHTTSNGLLPGWKYDKGRNLMYFVPFQSKELLFLDPATLKVVHKLAFSDIITHMEFTNDRVYVSSGAQIYVIDPTTKQRVDTHLFDYPISKFSVFKNKIFVGSRQYNMTDKTESAISVTGVYWSQSFLHPTKEILYLTGNSGTVRLDANTFTILDKTKISWEQGFRGEIFTNKDSLFFKGLEVNASVVSDILGSYGSRDFSEPIKLVNDEYVITNQKVYDRHTYLPKQMIVDMVQGISDTEFFMIDDNLYVYLPAAQTIILTKLLPGLNESEFKVKNPPSVVEFSTPITSYYHDKDNNRIYAVFKNSNELVAINAENMSVVNRMFIGSRPVKITKYKEKLYIGFDGRSSLLELSTDLQSKRYIEIGKLMKDFVIIQDTVYLLDNAYSATLYLFHLNTNELVKSPNYSSFYSPIFEVNQQLTIPHSDRGYFGLLPLDELGNYYKPFSGFMYIKDLPKINHFFQRDGMIYFGHYKVKFLAEGMKVEDVQKVVNSSKQDYLLNVVGDRLVTNLAVYNAETKEPLHDLPEEAKDFFVDNAQNGYLISKDGQDIVKLSFPYKETTRMRKVPFYTEIRNAYLPSRLTDITGSFAKGQIEYLVGLGIINGYQDGTFRPKQTITNIEASAMIARAIDIYGKNVLMPKLVDIPASNKFYPLVMDQLDPNSTVPVFKNPSSKTTRKEMALALQSAFGLKGSSGQAYKDLTSTQYKQFVPAVGALAYHGITNGYADGTYKPDKLITRDEFAAFIARTIDERYNLAQ